MEKSIRWRLAQKLELQWWKRYLRDKDPSDYLEWKRNYWLDLLQKLEPELSLNPNQKVMDAGCGPAGIFIALPDLKVCASDPLLDAYDQNISHFKREDYSEVEFRKEGLEELKDSEMFDKVFCLNVINHVRNIEVAMDNLWRAVRPGGNLVLSIDAHNKPLFKSLFRLLPGDLLHPQQYDLSEYESMITSRGGKIEKKVLMKEEFFFDYWVLVGRK